MKQTLKHLRFLSFFSHIAQFWLLLLYCYEYVLSIHCPNLSDSGYKHTTGGKWLIGGYNLLKKKKKSHFLVCSDYLQLHYVP